MGELERAEWFVAAALATPLRTPELLATAAATSEARARREAEATARQP